MTTLSAREAADALEASSTGCPSRLLSQVRVGFRWPPPPPSTAGDDRGNHHNSHVEDEEHGAHPIRRFISALEKHPNVRVITFVNSTFGSGTGGRISVTGNNKADDNSNNDPVRARRPVDGGGDDDDDPMVDELFGTVLPCHGTLDSITFSRCVGITSTHLRSLLSSPSGPSSLQSVSLYDNPFHDPHKAAQAIFVALQSNCPLKDLHLIRCGLTTEGCRSILDGASHNLHLRALSVVEPDRLVVESSDTLAGALGRRSRLQSLRVGARTWTGPGVEGLIRLLRTNDTLESLDLSGGDCDGGGAMHEPFRDVFVRYNFSLRYLLLPPGTAGNLTPADDERRRRNELDRVLDRNVRVTGYCQRLHDHGVPAIGTGRHRAKLWAESIGPWSSFPTLIYRLLRRNGSHHGVALAEACLLHPPDPLRRHGLKRRGMDDAPVPNRAARRRRVKKM